MSSLHQTGGQTLSLEGPGVDLRVQVGCGGAERPRTEQASHCGRCYLHGKHPSLLERICSVKAICGRHAAHACFPSSVTPRGQNEERAGVSKTAISILVNSCKCFLFIICFKSIQFKLATMWDVQSTSLFIVYRCRFQTKIL